MIKVVRLIGLNTLYRVLRKLAKTNRYQTLYSNSKEGCVNLFGNTADYTDFQVAFLQYLSFYNSLSIDVYMGDVGEVVYEDEIYEDAYIHYKNKIKAKKKLQQPSLPKTNKSKASNQKQGNINNTHVVFSQPRLKK